MQKLYNISCTLCLVTLSFRERLARNPFQWNPASAKLSFLQAKSLNRVYDAFYNVIIFSFYSLCISLYSTKYHLSTFALLPFTFFSLMTSFTSHSCTLKCVYLLFSFADGRLYRHILSYLYLPPNSHCCTSLSTYILHIHLESIRPDRSNH